jgi:mannose-1-phosphate guanylyltransferase
MMPRWTVILAAGAGRRLAAVTGGVPKQFWRKGGGASLLDQTLDRFAPMVPGSRTVVIVDATHRHYVIDSGLSLSRARVVVQPEDRGTAAGVLLALTPVLEADPDALVVMTPSDHGVMNGEAFRRGVMVAARQAHAWDDIVLFGVAPTAARDDYGWITVGRTPAPKILPVVLSFVEKPAPDVAADLLGAGAVWNTMVMVARAGTLRDLYARLLPDLTRFFTAALRLGDAERSHFLAAGYPAIPKLDLSRDLLARASGLSAYVWPESLGWSDLGTPERLEEWSRRARASTLNVEQFTAA